MRLKRVYTSGSSSAALSYKEETPMRSIRSRAFLPALAAMVLAAVLVVTPAAARTDVVAKRQATTTITFWQTMNDEETKTLRTIVAAFGKANPSIKVNMQYVPFDQAQARYATAAQGGKAPDVLRAEIAWIADYAARGFLADLSKHISGADRRDFLPSAFAYGVWRGKTYAVPQVTDAPALLYNKAMLRAANVAVPTTIAQLETACAKFGAGKGIFLRGDAYFVQPWIWAYGGGLVNPLKREILIASKGSIAGMTAYKRLFDASCAFKNEDFANDYNNAQTAFKNGDVAMIENGPWATADVLAGKAFANKANLGVAPMPRGPAGQGSPVGGHSYVISRKAKNVAAAYRFIQFMSKASNQATLAAKNNLLPTRKSAYQAPAVKRNAIISAFLKQMLVARARPVLPEGGAIYTDFGPNVQKVLLGQSTPTQGMVAVAQAWKTKLFRNYSIKR
jgi:arabinogalactan oligomer/maltooligosaccharide transport system substrate-binding protein